MSKEMYKNVDGVNIKMTDDEVAELEATRARWKAESDAVQYALDRQRAYGDWRKQLDQIYHEGIDAWKASIKKIKDDNPKP